MFGTSAQRARRRRRVASRASWSPLAACALSGLLLIASIGPGVARAEPVAAPGGPSSAAATKLKNELPYRGTIAPGQQLWYEFESAGSQRSSIEVRGETPLCSVRVTLLDARGRPLGQIISSTRETLPLIVYFPAHPVSETYYLRIDADPYAPCASTNYAFKLVEPEQPEPIECPPPPKPGEPAMCVAAAKAESVPAFESRACASDEAVLDHINAEVARVRGLVARRRASVGTLRRLQGEERTDHRRANVHCTV